MCPTTMNERENAPAPQLTPFLIGYAMSCEYNGFERGRALGCC